MVLFLLIQFIHQLKKVSYAVEPTRVGESAEYDQLTLEIETNGALKPYEALTFH